MFTENVLYSDAYRKIYIGFTSDIKNGLIAHNHFFNKGWTRKFQPWRIIYQESFENKSDAMIREKQLKSAKSREFIKTFIPICE